MKVRCLALVVLSLSGCMSKSESIMAPDGRRAFMVTCDSRIMDTRLSADADCFKEAEKQCPRGYDVISSKYAQMMISCK